MNKNHTTAVLSRRAWLEQSQPERGGDEEPLPATFRKQLAERQAALLELNARWEQVSLDLQEKLDELRDAVDRHKEKVDEARRVARGLWAAMPPAGRLAYFESG